MEAISTYTDAQAVEDGELVAVTPKDRATSALYEFLVDNLGETPPAGWPVELMGWCTIRKDDEEPGLRRALAATRGLIDVHRHAATRIYEENIDGGIWAGYIQQGAGDVITGFDTSDSPSGDRKVWMLPNKQGGLTLMFPEDY